MKTVDEIIRAVAELPDRNSPEDQPEMMLVTADELREIIEAAPKEREGEIVITKNEAGQICMVSRQDEEGRILSILAESEAPPKAQPMSESDLSDLMDEVEPFCTPYQFKEIVRAAERHHKIGE